MGKKSDKQSLRYLGIVMMLLILAVQAGAYKARVIEAADAAVENCHAVSQKIFEFKEPGRQEFKSSQLYVQV